MRLDAEQVAEAHRIYAIAIRHGLPPQRAQELAVVALHEGGLHHGARNPSSGAAGEFQLLSPGYVNRAKQHGGVYNTRANEEAILPDYINYWRGHPHAQVGAAGAAVERSGKGAGYYGASYDEFNFLRGGGGSPAPGPMGATAGAATGAATHQARAQLAMTLIQNLGQHGHPDLGALTDAVKGLHAAHETDQAQPQPQADPAHPGAIVRGGFAFPVAGPSSFTDDFGAPRPGHRHAGIDIPAKAGTPLVAVQDGVVTAAGPSGAAGNRVWINGQWFYAHLSRIAVKPGQRVRRGQVVGYVGATGDATGPHLHFGWSPNGSSGASWANPYHLLRRLHG